MLKKLLSLILIGALIYTTLMLLKKCNSQGPSLSPLSLNSLRPTLLISLATLSLAPTLAHGQESTTPQPSSLEDAYDPFADYSDFVEASTEENDVNFFKFGRMVSLGALLGYKGFTQQQKEIYTGDLAFGGFFTYYMSIQFAFQFTFASSTHDVGWSLPDGSSSFDGKARYNVFSLHGKYFFNTQNLTKAIARFNPFVVGGASINIREVQSPEQVLFSAKETATSFDLGLGVEYLFNNNRNFITFQGLYAKLDYPDENEEISVLNGNDENIGIGIKPKGDPFFVSFSFGFNF